MQQTIAYITDIHLDEAFVTAIGLNARENWMRIINDLKTKGVKSVVYGGDIGEASAHPWFFESLTTFNLDLTLGNHDTFAETSKYFQGDEWTGKTERYYTKEDNYFKHLFLDSSTNVLTSAQLQWLTKELSTEKIVLLFIHHPILAVDTAVDKTYPLLNREQVKQLLLHRQGKTIIFCGHYHMPDEKAEASIQQFITPASSYQIVKDAKEITTDISKFGYRLIHFKEKTMATELVWLENSH